MKRLGKWTGEGEIRKAENWAKDKIGKTNHNSIGITVQFGQNLIGKVNLNKSKVRGLNWYS